MALTIGTQLGPYTITAPLGAGGMGEVYKARDTRLNRTVAIKVLPAQFSNNAEMKARFEHEARTIARLNHPHICVLHDVGHQDGIDFLVMEYINGTTLAAQLRRGRLPVEYALQLAIQIANALDIAHRQGIVHRDLKPGNIMLTTMGAKLLDFGLAQFRQSDVAPEFISASAPLTEPTNLTLPGGILGTPQYMSPEQVECKEIDARSDIFSFGALIYEVITGHRAFRGESTMSILSAILRAEPEPLQQIAPGMPAELVEIIERCLRKELEQRFQNMDEVKSRLEALRGHGTPGRPQWGDDLLEAANVTVVAARNQLHDNPDKRIRAAEVLGHVARCIQNISAAISDTGQIHAPVVVRLCGELHEYQQSLARLIFSYINEWDRRRIQEMIDRSVEARSELMRIHAAIGDDPGSVATAKHHFEEVAGRLQALSNMLRV